MMFQRRDVLFLSASIVGALLVPTVALADEPAWKAVLGQYKFAGGKKEDAERLAAIDRVADQMSIFARGIARSKLRDATKISDKLVITADTKKVSVAQQGRVDTAPLDGRAVKVKAQNGDSIDLKYKLQSNAIIQIFTDGSKGSFHTFSLSREKLVVQTTIFASQLPDQVRYNLTYTRA